MNKKGIMNKLLAAALTLAFMALVRPDPDPSIVGVSLVAILLYEVLRFALDGISEHRRQMLRSRRRIESLAAGEEDIRRWADTWLVWPLKEVS